jgi:starvation-inducible outer membrane lipoprotein
MRRNVRLIVSFVLFMCLLLVACGDSPIALPVQSSPVAQAPVEVTRIVEVTKQVEITKIVEITKQVEVTKIVEKGVCQ